VFNGDIPLAFRKKASHGASAEHAGNAEKIHKYKTSTDYADYTD
jgi:hypothetical protein